jgi:UDP-N-acetylmuramoyl-L-alanyl-D-glutamate--2,6-diaminopimelate ligase
MSAMSLRQLIPDVSGLPDLQVDGLCLDSRSVEPGDAFIALAGGSSHGLDFATAALQRGAACVLFEPPPGDSVPAPAGAWPVPGLRSRLGGMAAMFNGHPSRSLQMIGVTGTNGKTSTVRLLADALQAAGTPCASIGTLGIGFAGQVVAGERTTPDVLSLHRQLAALRAAGAQAVAMEVSSHALAQGRVDAVEFDIAVFTNLSRDHLDYHGDMESYAAAKARLFAWPGLGAAVINFDDDCGRAFASGLAADVRLVGVSSRAAADATVRAASLQLHGEGISFELEIDDQRQPVSSRLLGRFNVDNLLAVAAVLHLQQWPLKQIAAALTAAGPVCGRMNRLGGGPAHPLVVIDYAHTPDALVQALAALRAHTVGRLICVFGCGGERDAGKRPQMGAAAEAGADSLIVTDDNPRREDGDTIVAAILAGMRHPDAAQVLRNRREAIAAAISGASAADTVLIAGKGHETYQETGTQRLPFDDAAVAREQLQRVAA